MTFNTKRVRSEPKKLAFICKESVEYYRHRGSLLDEDMIIH